MKIAQVAPLAESVPPKLYAGLSGWSHGLPKNWLHSVTRLPSLRAPIRGPEALWRQSGLVRYDSADPEPIQPLHKRLYSMPSPNEHTSSTSFTLTWTGSTCHCCRLS